MPLNIGNKEATAGMAQTIYLAIDEVLRPALEPALQEKKIKLEDVRASQESWKLLSFAIATGVITHLQRNPPTEVNYAEAFSSAAEDTQFWSWLGEFADIFATWARESPGDVGTLRTNLQTFFARDNHPVPQTLTGVIR